MQLQYRRWSLRWLSSPQRGHSNSPPLTPTPQNLKNGGRLSIHIDLLPVMSNATAVARSAPIAIAPKPPKTGPITARRQDSLSSCGRSFTSRDLESDRFRPQPTCTSCRRSRIECIKSEDDEGCIPCQLNGSECSLMSSPQPRKRKLGGDSGDEDPGKRRSVVCPLLYTARHRPGG